jgi:RNase P/RNase MRP subunit p30
MKSTFVDLHLRLNVNDPAGTMKMLRKAKSLGYGMVGVPLTTEIQADEISKVQTACDKVGVNFASRANLYPRSPDDLTRQLRRLRRKFEVICVVCESKAVARQAAKDRRVDLLSFPLLDFRKRFFDRAEAELARTGLAALEIITKPLLVLESAPRIRLLSYLRREVAIAKSFGVPVVVSSGVSQELLLRNLNEMAALSFLFGLDKVFALDACSKIPFGVVKRNREKLGRNFVAPGIKLVKEGRGR